MKFSDFLNEATGEFVKVADLKRNAKAEFTLAKPRYEIDKYTTKPYKDYDSNHVEIETGHEFDDIAKFLIRFGAERDDDLFVFNKGTKKEFTTFITKTSLVYDTYYKTEKQYVHIVFDVSKQQK